MPASAPSTAAVRRLNSSLDTAWAASFFQPPECSTIGLGRVESRAAALGFQDELGPDDEREAEQQHRLAAMGGEEAGDAVPIRRQVAGRRFDPWRRRFPRRNCPRRGSPRRGRSGCRPRSTDSAASSTRNGRRWVPMCSLRIDTSARDWRNAVVLSITIRLGCWPVVEEECNSRTTFSGGTALSRKCLNIATGSGGTSAGDCQASDVAAELVEEAAIGRAALGHLAAERAQHRRQHGVLLGLRHGVLRAADQGVDLVVNHTMLPLAVSPA